MFRLFAGTVPNQLARTGSNTPLTTRGRFRQATKVRAKRLAVDSRRRRAGSAISAHASARKCYDSKRCWQARVTHSTALNVAEARCADSWDIKNAQPTITSHAKYVVARNRKQNWFELQLGHRRTTSQDERGSMLLRPPKISHGIFILLRFINKHCFIDRINDRKLCFLSESMERK